MIADEVAVLVDVGRWQLFDDGRGIEKTFKFHNFGAAWVCWSPPSPSIAGL